MKYKVGDRVRIRSDLKEYENYEEYRFVSSMGIYQGEEVIITEVNSDSYSIDIDCGAWKWTDEMFESSEEMSAMEAIQFLGEFCTNTPCCDCVISKLNVGHTCKEITKDFPKRNARNHQTVENKSREKTCRDGIS